MKIHPFAVAGSISLLLSGCVTKMSKDPDAPSGPPSATVTYQGGQAAYWASAGGGKGTLYFNGRRYGFTATGLGAGGTGGQSVSATGEVYNLTSLSDFAGSYTSKRSGFTIIKGKTHAKLTNSKGVVIYMSGKTTGLASSGGVSTVTITFD